MATTITADDVRELNESCAAEATMIRWSDTGTIEIIPYALFGDITFDDRNREHVVVIRRADLHSVGDTDWDNATDEDYAAWAETLTETLNDALLRLD